MVSLCQTYIHRWKQLIVQVLHLELTRMIGPYEERERRYGYKVVTLSTRMDGGIYDLEYLNYIRQLLSLLPTYGLTAFVSIHQDVWSRYSGGSGAPAWTLELAGFDLDALEETGAAWLLGVKGGGHEESERGVWPTGYTKLAAATMA
ncbi:hypothetical protein C0992_005526 [Termitomyces sp. T32_za158]|nr:hypothetical protein C0992_005526 [Termitomyces sp. T32_za158]